MDSKLCIQHTFLLLSECVIPDLLNKNMAKQEQIKGFDYQKVRDLFNDPFKLC